MSESENENAIMDRGHTIARCHQSHCC